MTIYRKSTISQLQFNKREEVIMRKTLHPWALTAGTEDRSYGRQLLWKKCITMWAVVIGCAALAGCVVKPKNGDAVVKEALEFAGYAEYPASTIEIEAYDKNAGVWQIVATTTASSRGTPVGNQKFYHWEKEFDFTTVPDWKCYWGDENCELPHYTEHLSAKFRFREVKSYILEHLVTFDQGGFSCVIDKMNEGLSMVDAGSMCSSKDSPILTLREIRLY